MLHIKVPATTANMGPGFDSIGMAFKLYNNIWVDELSSTDKPDKKVVFNIKRHQGIDIPTDETNLIYQSIVRFYDEIGVNKPIPRISITQEDYIPPTRGLGSSAACIIAGLMAANELSGKGLSKDRLAQLAAGIEGHPDNTTPALLGGVVIGVLDKNKLFHIKLDNDNIKRLKFAVMIPEFPLSTEKARGILPKSITIADGIFNASRTALMTAALTTGDFDKLMVAMDDSFHQPYRSKIIPNMDYIFDCSKKCGAKGVFLSGAGPTIIAIATDDSFVDNLSEYINKLDDKWDISFIEPDFDGAQIIKK